MQKNSSTFSFRINRLSPGDMADLAVVAKIEQEAFNADAQTIGNLAILARLDALWVAKTEDGSIAGEAIVLGGLEKKEAFLFSLAVDSKLRRHGAATSLMSAVIEYLRKRKISLLSLTCDPKNAAALHLYLDKFAFVKAEELPNHFGPNRHRLLLCKRLFDD